MNPGKFAFLRGEIVPIEQAQVSIMTHALNYGTGCFEGVRGYWNERQRQIYIFRLPDHFRRMAASGRILMMDLPHSNEDLCQLTVDLMRRNGHTEDTYIRPLLYKSSTLIGVRLHNLEHDFAMYTAPFGSYVEAEGPVRIRTSSWRRVEDTSAPARAKITGTYVNAALAKTEAILDGYAEALVLNEDGHVAEGSAENLFAVIGGKLVTPALTDNILAGITRSTLIELARDELGVPTVERSLDRTELYIADEVFLCGTGAQMVPVNEIDHRTIGNGETGEFTAQLTAIYERIVRGDDDRYAHWRTPVYTDAQPAPRGQEPLMASR